MSEINRLLDQLQRAFEGDAWSGPNLLATLAGITAEQAAARPLAGAHRIWELVLHLTTWLQVGRQRLLTHSLIGPSEAENWPDVPAEATEAAWQQALLRLRQAHEQLLAAVASLTDADLDRSPRPLPEYPAGTPGSYYVLLHGLVQHNQYHTGQIALLRKALSA
ncbi:DinB family protein [Hymenobacter metallilatus]|uniref:DinB family protein n=1 Tax=Hymenobacter metallilatus TaxID=2493666 RepID=A0A3R9M8N0_9BACT|nr:DinB family protein [Hymenobacter metallilatus]RSK35239.1 DinB family protein [Hymenobacter metallilatus]